ncbi:MAG: hypothetical protein EZS28_021031 [Streblomastix strix]|uniref:Uncharacterized protein n=1 Tax=Streblomastix strix TaxID=222440 RepID=A0A5J4VLH7_9EUKA|nr:MAG: hypothetical protein EZS28_021031 [Streblomastix strix]
MGIETSEEEDISSWDNKGEWKQSVLMLIEPTACVNDRYEDVNNLLSEYNENSNEEVDASVRKPIIILVDGNVAQTRGLNTFNVIVPSISHPVPFELNGDALEPVEETIYTDDVENGSIIKILPYNDTDTIFSVYRDGLPVNINLSKADYTKFNIRPGYFYVALDAEQSNDIPNALNELNISVDTLAGLYLHKNSITEEDLNYVVNNFNKNVLEYFVVNNEPFIELQTLEPQKSKTLTRLDAQIAGDKIDEDATKIKEEDGVLRSIPSSSFKDYVNLKVGKLPNNITQIGKEAFKNTKISNLGLEMNKNGIIYLGNGNIEFIDDQAFENCTNLDADFIQTISTTTKHLGYRAFAGSSICGPTMDLDLGKISEIGDECFADCNFKNLILSDYNLKIGTKAFHNCTFQGIINFSNVKNINSLTASSIERNLKIQPYAFEKCIINGAGGIKFNTSVKEIPAHIFEGCYFKDLQIPAHVHTIGDYAFANIEGTATLPENTLLSRIGNYTFYNAKNLTIKKFPERLTFVGDYAFANTHISNDITLNDVQVGTSTFENVDSKNLFIKGNVSVDGYNSFYSVKDTVNVEYDKGSTDEGFFNGKNVLNVICTVQSQ